MSLGLLSANFLKHSLFLYPPFGDFCLAPFFSTTNFCFL